MTERELN